MCALMEARVDVGQVKKKARKRRDPLLFLRSMVPLHEINMEHKPAHRSDGRGSHAHLLTKQTDTSPLVEV